MSFPLSLRAASLLCVFLAASAPAAEAQWTNGSHSSQVGIRAYGRSSAGARGDRGSILADRNRSAAPFAGHRIQSTRTRRIWVPARQTSIVQCGVRRLQVIPAHYAWVREPVRCTVPSLPARRAVARTGIRIRQ